jgi:hypothetical protein
MANVATGIVRNGPRGEAAIKMDPSVTAGAWFFIHPKQGGYYSDGTAEKVDEWPQVAQLNA